ncbi:MAG TPA: ABC transporter permease [Trueperaceae bacterium]|nr:ABC transporter permease [Trueperaceae bacterium]
MTSFLAQRFLSMLLTALIVSILVVLLVHAVPGNIVQQMLGQLGAGSSDARATLEAYFGLNRPMHMQYLDWLGELMRGSLGDSWNQGTPVVNLVLRAFAVSAELAVLSLLFALLVGSLLGIAAALFHDTVVDLGIQAFNVLGLSLPAFWVGAMMLVVASNVFGWGPPFRYAGPLDNLQLNAQIMVLPMLALGLFNAAAISQFVRDLVLEAVRLDFVRTATAKGASRTTVYAKHTFRNILVPLTSFTGVIFIGILGGVVAIEAVFNLPGIGRLILWALQTRDYPVVQGGVFLMAAVTLLVTLAVDFLYAVFDPRITYA